MLINLTSYSTMNRKTYLIMIFFITLLSIHMHYNSSFFCTINVGTIDLLILSCIRALDIKFLICFYNSSCLVGHNQQQVDLLGTIDIEMRSMACQVFLRRQPSWQIICKTSLTVLAGVAQNLVLTLLSHLLLTSLKKPLQEPLSQPTQTWLITLWPSFLVGYLSPQISSKIRA